MPAVTEVVQAPDCLVGGCQCGAVRYRVAGTVEALFACHCHECQKQSGSAFGMALWVAYQALEVSGTLRDWHRLTPSGNEMRCQFCPECGSRVFHWSHNRERVVSIKPGTLDSTDWLHEMKHIWQASAQPWFCFGDAPAFARNPDSLAALSWQTRNEQEG